MMHKLDSEEVVFLTLFVVLPIIILISIYGVISVFENQYCSFH